MVKILLYSFEKYDKLTQNPSTELAKLLVNSSNKKINIKHVILRPTFDSWPNLLKQINAFKPSLVIGIGVAPGRSRVCLEKVALNVIDNPKPDDKGKVLRHFRISAKAPLALETNFDVINLYNYFKKFNIPVKISYFADTYVCNYTYFNCLNYIRENNIEIKCIFIHIPLSPEETNKLDNEIPSFPVEKITSVLSNYVLK